MITKLMAILIVSLFLVTTALMFLIERMSKKRGH